MIKSRIITILLSGCLIAGIGIGNFLLKSDDKKIVESSKNLENNDVNNKVDDKNENKNNDSDKAGQADDNNLKDKIDNNTKEDSKKEDNIKEDNTKESNNKEENISENITNNNDNTNSNNETSNQAPKETKKDSPVVVEERDTEIVETQAPAPSKEIPTQPEVSSSFIAEIEQAIFARVNQERAAAGLPALAYNNTMEHYARVKSQDMGDRGYFDHANPEGQLITAQMQADGVSYRAWGENIAYISGMSGNAQLATKFMDNWMNSPGHRANILSTNFASIGVGVYKIGNTYYATQEFHK